MARRDNACVLWFATIVAFFPALRFAAKTLLFASFSTLTDSRVCGVAAILSAIDKQKKKVENIEFAATLAIKIIF